MATVAASQNFRHNLRCAMAARGLSQRSLAIAASMNHPDINRILMGKQTPSIDTCERLAAAVGFGLSELIATPKKFQEIALTVGTN